jgi:energy-coupling factor transporter ATP-binding protein EcfA2
LDLDVSKSVVVICGENGTGKSTLVDAIEFVANGTPGSLERRDTPVAKYLPALGRPSDSLRVALTARDVEYGACLQGSHPTFIGDDIGRPKAHVLRRGDILNLVLSRPADRYKALSRFIAVPGVATSEDQLRKAESDAHKNLDESAKAQADAETKLMEVWEGEGRPDNDPVSWAETLSQRGTEVLRAETDQLNATLTALANVMDKLDDLEEAKADHVTKSIEVRNAEDAVRKNEQCTVGIDAELLDLLETAEKYVSARPSHAYCPVCEQAVNVHKLRERLKQRQAAGQQLRRLTDDAKRAKTSAERSLAEIDRCRVAIKAAEEKLDRAVRDAKKSKNLQDLKLMEPGEAGVQPTPMGANEIDEIGNRSRSLVSYYSSFKALLEERRDKARDDAEKYNFSRVHLETLRTAQQDAARHEKIHSRLKMALNVAESIRKQFIEGQLAEISVRVCELYGLVHPNEELGKITFALDPSPKRRGSLNLTGKFETEEEITPAGYYSDSHLDTLGICVFLALAERTMSEKRPNVLILDDILTSADMPHIDRIISMIHDLTIAFDQILITTHSRFWFESYRRNRGPIANTQLVELGQWTLEHGIRSNISPLPTEELRDTLSATRMDRQAVASRSGVILEDVLGHLAECYRLRLPCNRMNQHTIADLLSAIPKKLRQRLIAFQPEATSKKTRIDAEPILDAIDSLVPIRNWLGAHRNPLGDDVPESTVRALGENALALAAFVTCSSCGQRVGKRAGTHWTCRCQSMRLEPLAQDGQAPPTEDVIP